MKHFYLIEKSRRGKLPGVRGLIEEYIRSHGAEVISASDIDGNEIPPATDCLIVMGGDGTMMKAAGATAGKNIPIIGINVGNLGYLTSVSTEEEIIPMLDKLLTDDYSIEKHGMIKGTWTDADGEHTEYSFNDINISRRASRAIRMTVSVNGELLNEYPADGIIVSTPTGSTAYNLAAGGPIVETSSDVMILTPICPHAFMARSVVLSMDNEIEVLAVRGSNEDEVFAEAAFDGKTMGCFTGDTRITIRKAEYSVPMIRLSGDSYFKALRRKMNQIRG